MSGRIGKASGERESNAEKASSCASEENLNAGTKRKTEEDASENAFVAIRLKKDDSPASVTENSRENQHIHFSDTTIFALNTDCWVVVFSYLSLRDQLQVATSNRYLKTVFHDLLYKRYKHLTESGTTNIDETDLHNLLEIVGENVLSYESSLDPQANGDQHLWLLRRYCPNLQYLKMAIRRTRWFDLQQLKNLTSLHVYLDFASPEIYRDFVFGLLKLPCLKKLKLEARDYKLNGLHVLKNLEFLEIKCLPALDANCLVDCCTNMKQLRHLNVGQFIDNLTTENFRIIVTNCRQLESLVFGEGLQVSSVAYEIVCQLPKLKHLQLWHTDSIRPSFIEGMINKTGAPLECLILTGFILKTEQVQHLCEISSLRELSVSCETVPLESLLKLKNLEALDTCMPTVTNDQLLALLMGCPLLSVLSASHSLSITSEFVSEATRLFSSRKIKIYLHETSVDWDALPIANDNKFIQFVRGKLSSPILINHEIYDK
ncbi:uncharacterized protein LOC108027823 [Drosophila biarmipes]|uniref:uncharacterized protein LOC108027823 n=1 Tax=Drosophila biarmipes TaxID=125945 RepID=UPI0007E7B99E|nr:uncharacterized protein LOC108027823 [Drosophila biarmipes]